MCESCRTDERGTECRGKGTSWERLPRLISEPAVQLVGSEPGRHESHRALQGETQWCEGAWSVGETRICLMSLALMPEVGVGVQGRDEAGEEGPDDETTTGHARLYLIGARGQHSIPDTSLWSEGKEGI